jgi:hypothetical protein
MSHSVKYSADEYSSTSYVIFLTRQNKFVPPTLSPIAVVIIIIINTNNNKRPKVSEHGNSN